MIKYILLVLIMATTLFSSEDYLSNEHNIIKLANHLKLYETNQWKSLLNYHNKLNIKDKKFILSKNFSLKNELDDTIRGFYIPKKEYKNINNHPQCRFPARFLFISHELNITKNEFPKINCPDFNIYKEKAPADNISLIYVAGDVKNPSSMMGHTFLKFSGINYQNKQVSHAISFSTIIQSQDPLTLIYQNIFSGMKGIFALQPYQKMLEQYTQIENRNVWEYQLRLSNYQRKLIYYHVWELKGINMKYFFTGYNCSTVVYYDLSLADPKIYNDKKLWITPLDTVKFLYKYHLIKKITLLASNDWLVEMLEENTKSSNINKIKNIVQYNKYKNIHKLDFYSLKLLSAYANLEYNKKNISKSTFKDITTRVDKKLEDNNDTLDISQYKSPDKIPDERQLEVGYSNINDNEYTKVSFLGASHLINDNNREYFGESELKIGYLSLLANTSHLELNEFTLYGMKSYVPYNTLTHDLSYQFELSVKKEYTKSFNYLDTAEIDGGIGTDFLIAKDINLFFIANGGIGYNVGDKLHLFFNPEVGVMIYEVFNMKSFLSYQPLFIGMDKVYDKFTLKHNIFLNSNWTIGVDIQNIRGIKKYINYGFSIKYLF